MDARGAADGRTAARFAYTHSRAYRESQQELEMCVASGDPNSLQRLLQFVPYQVRSQQVRLLEVATRCALLVRMERERDPHDRAKR